MKDASDHVSATRSDDDAWFDEMRIVDAEWVEVRVRTSKGNQARYRVPRRTLFDKVDQAAR